MGGRGDRERERERKREIARCCDLVLPPMATFFFSAGSVCRCLSSISLSLSLICLHLLSHFSDSLSLATQTQTLCSNAVAHMSPKLEQHVVRARRFVAHVQKSTTRAFQEGRLHALCERALSLAVFPREHSCLIVRGETCFSHDELPRQHSPRTCSFIQNEGYLPDNFSLFVQLRQRFLELLRFNFRMWRLDGGVTPSSET